MAEVVAGRRGTWAVWLAGGAYSRFPASIVPVVVGAAMARFEGPVAWWLLPVCGGRVGR